MKCICAFALLMAIITAGCSEKNDDPGDIVTPVETVLKRDEVMRNVRKNLYHIEEWYIVKGKDTTFLNSDQHYDSLMKHVYVQFFTDEWSPGRTWLCYRRGDEVPNTEFSGHAEIFDVIAGTALPLGFDYAWDEKAGTISVTRDVYPISYYVPRLFPEGVTIKLDKNGYTHADSFDEVKASRTSGTLRFRYQHEGRNYTFLLKQMWPFSGSANIHRYVAF